MRFFVLGCPQGTQIDPGCYQDHPHLTLTTPTPRASDLATYTLQACCCATVKKNGTFRVTIWAQVIGFQFFLYPVIHTPQNLCAQLHFPPHRLFPEAHSTNSQSKIGNF